MADIDDDYEGDLGPLLADLAALRTALGDSYQAYGEINPDVEDIDWQQQIARTTAPIDAAPRRVVPRKEPAPLIERLAAVTAALEANQSLQQRLQRLISSVNRAQDQALGIRDRVRASQRRRQVAASAPHALSSRRSEQDQQFTGVSWFWSQPGAPAPPPYVGFNEIKTVVEVLPLVFPRRRWQEEELNALCDGVLQVVQERLLNRILTDLESTPVLNNNMTSGEEGGGAGDVFQAGISLEEFEARQAPIRLLTASSPEVIAIAATLTDAEWATVAHRSVHGRTARECSLAWQNAAMPTITHEKFTEEEDSQLVNLVEQHGTRNWYRIGAELQASSAAQLPQPLPQPPTQPPPSTTATGATATAATATAITKRRTPVACMARYQQLLHATRGIQEFTDTDRERLIQIVNKVGVQWKRVAEEFGGPWSDDQLMHQWRRHAQRHEGGVNGTPAGAVVPRRGKWLPEEDESLLTAVALYGKKWSHVAKLVPGRSDVQCRERYANCLDPEVNKEPWTGQEDEILFENVERFTNQATRKVKWSSIAELMPGRTDYAVKKRWVALTNAQSRARGRGGGGRGRRARRRGRGASNLQERSVHSGDDGVGGEENRGNGGAGPSNAVGSNGSQSSGGFKKKESARNKKQKVQFETQAAAVAASVEPPPPSEEPSVTRRGRAITIPTRLAE